jgi:hypothetical protein
MKPSTQLDKPINPQKGDFGGEFIEIDHGVIESLVPRQIIIYTKTGDRINITNHPKDCNQKL